MAKIRVLLAEDHKLVRKGIKSLLQTSDTICIVAEVGNGVDVLKKCREIRPDVVLMDISMSPMDGIMATRALRSECPDATVLILTMHEDFAYVEESRAAGASGYLMKQTDVCSLIKAIEIVHDGGTYFPSDSREMTNNASRQRDKGQQILTNREMQVLKLLAEGKSIRESAQMLGITQKTIETHRTHIMKKLDLHTIAELTQYAIRTGLIRLEV